MEIQVIGAGLAGCEAAWQLAQRGVPVRLYDMKPHKRSAAHHMDALCELVCSNSLKSSDVHTASGLLKAEMRLMGSLILEAAQPCAVKAGSALAVDREAFAHNVTARIEAHPSITVMHEEVTHIDDGRHSIVATGPLTSETLSADIEKLLGGDPLYFYDAAAPIVSFDSIDMDTAFFASRYGKGEDDYINCPLNETQYQAFYRALIQAETAPARDFESAKVFEACMPIELLARRGEQTIAYGPFRPVGILDPRTGRRPYAVLQLRREDTQGSMYNLVGCQTHLKFPEQRRVFRMIPGLEHAEFLRYGVMHRNTYIHGPRVLNCNFQMQEHPNVFFAGQITGVEGYVESACSGLLSALHMLAYLKGIPFIEFSGDTLCGALSRYVSSYAGVDYQPMNANFGILNALNPPVRNKRARKEALSARALAEIHTHLRSIHML